MKRTVLIVTLGLLSACSTSVREAPRVTSTGVDAERVYLVTLMDIADDAADACDRAADPTATERELDNARRRLLAVLDRLDDIEAPTPGYDIERVDPSRMQVDLRPDVRRVDDEKHIRLLTNEVLDRLPMIDGLLTRPDRAESERVYCGAARAELVDLSQRLATHVAARERVAATVSK